MDKRSRYSGRSWCSMVAMDACSLAPCDSSAIVTLSRNRRWTRVLTVRRNHVPAADRPRAIAVRRSFVASPATIASAISLNQSASNASGTAETNASTNAHTIKLGSYRNPSRHRRHIELPAGGRSSGLREDVMRRALLVQRLTEALRLKVEHRAITPAPSHELVVRSQLDDPPLLQ